MTYTRLRSLLKDLPATQTEVYFIITSVVAISELCHTGEALTLEQFTIKYGRLAVDEAKELS